jgi:DNA-binding PadR family transcriptional regulator
LDASEQYQLTVSLKAYNWARALPIKQVAKKMVLLVLADYSTDTGKTYPTMKTLHRDSGLSTAAIIANIDMLIADGIITDTGKVTGEKSDVKVYQLNPIKVIEEKPKEPRKPREKTPEELLEAEKIYTEYPRGVAKRKSLLVINRCIKQFGFEIVMNGTKLFADGYKKSGTDIKHIPHSLTFYNNERFNDSPVSWGFERTPSAGRVGPTFGELGVWVREREHDKTEAAKIATGLYTLGQKIKWLGKDGKPIDWKNEFPALIAKWRAEQK